MSSKFITEIKQDASTEDYYIEIPDHILNTLKWKEGDEICWSISQGKIILTKITNSSSIKEEPTMSDYDWYTVKEEAIKDYLESESEGKEYKDFDEKYDQYIQNLNQDTYGEEDALKNYFYSPEAQGSWNQSIELKKDRVVPTPRNFPHFP